MTHSRRNNNTKGARCIKDKSSNSKNNQHGHIKQLTRNKQIPQLLKDDDIEYNGFPRSFRLRFKTNAQKDAAALFNKVDILFMIGPAGCGKSYVSTACAINELYEKRRSNIILTRPIVNADEDLGYLPGDMEEKADPYMRPLFDQIGEIVGYNAEFREQFDQRIEVSPLAYMRGRTFKNAVVVLDEAQNATFKQLRMFLTRFDENSKIIINGDPEQVDIPNSGLMKIIDRLSFVDGIGVVQFAEEDNVRHPLVTEITKRLKIE